MLIIDGDLQVLRCSTCRTVIEIPLRHQGAHSRVAYRDRMVIQHRCGAKKAVPEKAVQTPKTWAELIAPYADELARMTH